MKNNIPITVMAMILEIFAFLMTLAACLALMDISKGTEPDLRLEWYTVWYAIGFNLLAHIISFVAVVKLRFRKMN